MVALLFVLRGVQLGEPTFPVDDAYITQHNASVLFLPADPLFPEASPLDGATSPVHLLLVGLFGLAMPLGWAQFAAAGLAAIALALGGFRLARVFGASVPVAVSFVAIVLLAGETPHQLLNGLETGLALAVATWLLALAVDPGERARRAFLLLLGTTPWIRPEFVAFGGLLFLGWSFERGRASPAGWSGQLRAALPLLLAGALPLFVWTFSTTGAPWPGTVAAKKYFFAEGCLPASMKLRHTIEPLVGFVSVVGPALLGGVFLWRRPSLRVAMLFPMVLVAVYFHQLPGALGHYEHRYLYVVLPLLLAGWLCGLSSATPWVRRAATAGLALSVAFAVVTSPGRLRDHESQMDFSRNELRGVTRWVRENLPADARVLVHDVGYITRAGRPLVDVVGLKTPSNVLVHEELTWGSCGRTRAGAVALIAEAERADHFVVLDGWDRIYHFVDNLRSRGWQVRPADAGREGAAYRVFAIRPPSAVARP